MDEQEIRESERYRLLYQEASRHSQGLAGYITIAGGLMLISAIVFGGDGETNPYYLAGIGLSCLIGGGGYWLHEREESSRISSEMRSIERFFERRGFYIYPDGSTRRNGKSESAQ